jgi:multidrug transporter EmrE-like cation transporter
MINSKKTEVKISLRWIIAVALAFIGNGVCSAVQNVHQRKFVGEYKSEFMITALLTVSVILFVAAFFAERSDISATIKRGGYLMVLCGAANGAVNLFVMLLATRMNASIMYPVISAGGIILTWGVSRFMYKEKLTLGQNLALVFGIAAVVLMNL